MNKCELIEIVAEKANLSKKDAEAAVSVLFDTVADYLVAGDSVKVSGFGVFDIRKRQSRKGTNPRNGKEIKIPAASAVGFKASKSLKERVNK